jgi:hypothetical protein
VDETIGKAVAITAVTLDYIFFADGLGNIKLKDPRHLMMTTVNNFNIHLLLNLANQNFNLSD